MKKVLILGIGGQDGSYLADLLLREGWEVHGLHRHSSSYPNNLWRIDHILDKVRLHVGDILDHTSLLNIIDEVKPDVIYNEADQDNVGVSYSVPSYNLGVTAGGVLNLLQVVERLDKKIRVFQPLSATMFGIGGASPQDDFYRINPLSPYAVCKACAYHWCGYYRQVHNIFVSTAIFYNHESVRRRGDYLLHKICKQAILLGKKLTKQPLELGCLDMKVDIGCAQEYMEAAYKIMELVMPCDLVIGTGRPRMIVELVKEAFRLCEVPYTPETIKTNPNNFRPGPIPNLVADCSKAYRQIHWDPKRDAMDMLHIILDHYKKSIESRITSFKGRIQVSEEIEE